MRTLIVSLLAGFLLVLPGGAAQARASCTAPAYPSPNGTFNPVVTVRKVTCATANKLLVKHYTCRVKNGASGRCVQLVMHFACREERYADFYEPYFTETVTCAHGHKRVVFGFNQDKVTP